jgi:hypothetical protein
MTKVELLATMRFTLGDETVPYLWSDAELTGYIQEAEAEAVERADLLEVDGVATYCTVAITANTPAYALNSLVYEVERARIAGEGQYLKRTSRDKLDASNPAWEDETGTPREYYLTGNTLRLIPNPAANGTLNLVVLRLPVSPMGTSPEIHARHHRRMLDYAYKLANLKRDADTYDPVKANDFDRMFTESFGVRRDAKLQTRQLKHMPLEMRDEW